ELRMLVNADLGASQRDFERALSLAPSDVTTLRRYAIVLATLGRVGDAISLTQKATDLDPLSAPAWSNLGRYLLAAGGRMFEARAALHRALELAPDTVFAQFNLGVADMLDGRPKAAFDE